MQNNILQYVDFAKNIRKGDWNAAKDSLRLHPEAVSKQISYSGNTTLHIAILGGHTNIVEENLLYNAFMPKLLVRT